MIQGYLIAGIAGLALSVGAYFYGRDVESDIQEGIRAKAVLEQTQKTLEVERRYQELSNEVENALKPKLADATARGESLARSVRDYKERLRALSDTAGSTPESDAASRESEHISGLEERHYAACERDATRLDGWRNWYNGLSTEHGQ